MSFNYSQPFLSFGGLQTTKGGVSFGTSWTTKTANTNQRSSTPGGAGTVDAGFLFGGYGAPALSTSEEYNGTSWSAGGSMSSALFYVVGWGTQTSAVRAGGNGASSTSEEYNGTSWASGGTLSTGRDQAGGAGASITSGVIFGGYGGGRLSSSEEYNGTSWSAGGSLSIARHALGGGGIIDDALATGGHDGAAMDESDSYNGTSWTNEGTMNTATFSSASAGGGSTGIRFGSNASGTASETYEGTTWTSTSTLNTGNGGQGRLGDALSALTMAGTNKVVEQWA